MLWLFLAVQNLFDLCAVITVLIICIPCSSVYWFGHLRNTLIVRYRILCYCGHRVFLIRFNGELITQFFQGCLTNTFYISQFIYSLKISVCFAIGNNISCFFRTDTFELL